jgi:hypothetical protein
MPVSAQEIRAARSFLKRRKAAPPISPARFAAAAKEQGKSFSELIRFLMRTYEGQQNEQAQRREVVLAAAGAEGK